MRTTIITCDLCHEKMEEFSRGNGSVLLYRSKSPEIGYQEICPKCTDAMYRHMSAAVKERGQDVKRKS